ncbi:MAG: DUF2141 domain-containing protein [Parvularculaceae bacterium]
MAAKLRGEVNEDGVALVTFYGAKPGVYAFVAYFDENGDGKLNRSFIGKPKEPYVFSNDIRPKMRNDIQRNQGRDRARRSRRSHAQGLAAGAFGLEFSSVVGVAALSSESSGAGDFSAE